MIPSLIRLYLSLQRARVDKRVDGQFLEIKYRPRIKYLAKTNTRWLNRFMNSLRHLAIESAPNQYELLEMRLVAQSVIYATSASDERSGCTVLEGLNKDDVRAEIEGVWREIFGGVVLLESALQALLILHERTDVGEVCQLYLRVLRSKKCRYGK